MFYEKTALLRSVLISSHERIQSKGELYSKITEFLEVATYYGDKSTRYMAMNEARSKPLTGKLGPQAANGKLGPNPPRINGTSNVVMKPNRYHSETS